MEILSASLRIPDYIKGYLDAPRFLQGCNACENYARRWCCPPLSFDFQTYSAPYSYICIIGAKIPEPNSDAMLFGPRRAFAEYLMAQEDRHSRALIASSCLLCRRCARETGSACIHPNRLRYSLEAFGFDLARTAAELLGSPLSFDPGRSHTLLIGALLHT